LLAAMVAPGIATSLVLTALDARACGECHKPLLSRDLWKYVLLLAGEYCLFAAFFARALSAQRVPAALALSAGITRTRRGTFRL
jgi:hypothetical protein